MTSASGPTIAIVAPGSMGSAVARRLTSPPHPCTVLTSLDNRSPASISRARSAGMQDSPLTGIARRADWVLSIVPPASAESFAKEFIGAYQACEDANPRLVFVDCNALSPMTKQRVSSLFLGTSVRFLDARIIGIEPSPGYDPAFYAAASPKPGDQEALDAFERLGERGLNVKLLRGEGVGVGDAAALKMSYSGIAKGFIGLTATMILAAHASSPATAHALLTELRVSQPQYLDNIVRWVPGMFPKAYRFVAEMEEMAAFVRVGLGNGEAKILEGYARLFERIANARNGGTMAAEKEQASDVDVLRAFVEDAKEALKGAGEKEY
ncbi:hypothetical protein BD309DRAFT_980751 [Dichomitus squalens]|uniref:Uncharacterized protein n=1 Tax=Dichomitus squalens TaxID=114155 RepID=A0A4Q9NP86_9APHY|nr:hypothetical protein BD309DRAFT_980751 [Dichomitus squalens]TBU53177.1 hypothetical protein BD310DRAFT_830613 [Dichomitus squalens]